MKKVLSACLVVFVAIYAGTASAKVMKFPFIKCSIDVPRGWTVEEDEESDTVVLMAPDESAAVTLSGIEGLGAPLKEVAEQLSEEWEGTEPELKGNAFTFTFENDSGVTTQAVVSGNEEFVAVITVTGEHEAIAGMIDSIRGLD